MTLSKRLLLCAALGGALPACHPSAVVTCVRGGADVPDGALSDTDCDGIDGAIDAAVFVSESTGSDANDGSMSAPVATITHGLELAKAAGKASVLVANGYYSESIVLVEGIGIHGGYDVANGWSRSLETFTTIVSAPTSPVIRGTSIGIPTSVSGLEVVAPSAAPGGSSIAVWLVDASGVSLENCELRGGHGGDGADGATPSTIAAAGNPGANGAPPTCVGGNCLGNIALVSGRPAVTSSCSCGVGGGSSNNGLTSSGDAGGDGSYVAAAGCTVENRSGSPSAGGDALTSNGAGNGGVDGANGDHGRAGAGGVWTTSFYETGYFPTSGGAGQLGFTGGGGGGGGAAKNFECQNGQDVLLGGTGGSGGSGGCGGVGGGAGGGGGASIALYLWRSTPTLRDVALVPGDGGSGGDGAPGVDGGMGGAASLGGSSASVMCPGSGTIAAWGGSGGRGGHGGAGGAGGGGAGGVALGVFVGAESGIASGSHGVAAELEHGSAGAAGTGGSAGRHGVLCGAYHLGDVDCLAQF